ncbi:uncharacterized protein CMC5_014220 [Chondromyces crocatus]|uniref:Uncharacterized protein n=2 Tax=Chondromyces crocatus TaxID=52 RepID=A0A0K1E8T3_CHOCO|nr:uncharacterized protein CMC5_014220 [Chondromyces crocatus]
MATALSLALSPATALAWAEGERGPLEVTSEDRGVPARADEASAPEETVRTFTTGRVTEPRVQATFPWLLTQLIPSPEWVISDEGVRFGGRWQATPLLYSFGIDPRLSPWRSMVAEPIVRHAGSVELFVSPTYLAGGGSLGNRWLFRSGVRAYFPLLDRGEYLSCSVGGALVYHRDEVGVAYEAGIYTLFGVLGLQAAYTPTRDLRMGSLTLNIRYF